MSFFVRFGSGLIADAVIPVERGNPKQAVKNARLAENISRILPVNLYSRAAGTIMDSYHKTTRSVVLIGPMEGISMNRFDRALPFGQSTLAVAPYLTTLLALTAICSGTSYVVFIRQEVRSM